MWAAFYFPLSMIFTTRVQSHTFLTIYETKIELASSALRQNPDVRHASRSAHSQHTCACPCATCASTAVQKEYTFGWKVAPPGVAEASVIRSWIGSTKQTRSEGERGMIAWLSVEGGVQRQVNTRGEAEGCVSHTPHTAQP